MGSAQHFCPVTCGTSWSSSVGHWAINALACSLLWRVDMVGALKHPNHSLISFYWYIFFTYSFDWALNLIFCFGFLFGNYFWMNQLWCYGIIASACLVLHLLYPQNVTPEPEPSTNLTMPWSPWVVLWILTTCTKGWWNLNLKFSSSHMYVAQKNMTIFSFWEKHIPSHHPLMNLTINWP